MKPAAPLRVVAFFLCAAALCLVSARIFAQANPDGTYSVPIYINASDYTSNRYTIYADEGGGMKPYLFDTGAPNMFTVFNAQTPGASPLNTFTFANGDSYTYYATADSIGLGNSTGQTIVSTGTGVNIARVYQITSGTGAPVNTTGSILPDGTYGDFGAGLYGTSTLATVLAQVPRNSGVQVGYMVNLTNPSSGVGALTIGLTTDMIQAAKAAPGAITMQMAFSGDLIPTDTGFAFGYDKAQVGDTTVTINPPAGSPDAPVTSTLGTVFDTGGGPNAVVYDHAYAGLAGGTLTITAADGSTIVVDSGTTPWPDGMVDVSSDESGGLRVNPGGSIYENYEILFHLNESTGTNTAEGELILVPVSVPEPATLALLALAAAALILRRARARQLHATPVPPA